MAGVRAGGVPLGVGVDGTNGTNGTNGETANGKKPLSRKQGNHERRTRER
jgi:hypothetical protein